MTTSQSRNLRKAGAVALSLALAMSTLAITPASAAKKVKLAKTKITVNVGKTKTVKIKNVKKKQVKKLTVKSSKATVAKAKASKKTAIKVTGKKAGSAKVTANLKLKKKVGGKKAYKLTLKVTVKKATPAPAPTTAPTAAPTPVVSGSSITLDKPAGYTCSVKGAVVTVTANILPATSNEQVQWSVADPTIASVSGSGATVNGVATAALTGLKEGKTTLSAKIAAMTASAMVTVEKEKIFVKITDVKQTKANEIVVSFDKDARTDNQGFGGTDKSKFDIDVKNDKGQVTRTIPVNKVKTDAVSGTSATLTLDQAFNDKDKVTANLYKGTDLASSFDFDASVGAPASVGITKLQYQKDVDEKVEFAIYDAKGIDVTSAQTNLNATVTLSASADFPGTYNLGDLSNPTVKMNKVGATGTLTIEYKKTDNTTGKPDFTNSAVVTCIEPVPVVGTASFRKLSDGKKKWGTDETAKFYKGSNLTSVDVDAEGTTDIAFCATDEDGNVISYDTYAVSSSNGDVMSAVVVNDGGGKYANITLSGVKQGTATLNIKANKNTKDANYTIPVNVKKAASKIGTFSVTPNRVKVSNAFDYEYQGENELVPVVKDENGNDITKKTKITYEMTKPTKDDAKQRTIGEVSSGHKFEITANKKPGDWATDDETNYGTYDASGAQNGTYAIKATAEWGSDTKETTFSITVVNVPEDAYKTGTAISYKVEGTNELEISENKAKSGSARLVAYAGSVFAGYVNGDGSFGDYSYAWGYAEAKAGNAITGNVYANIKAGSKWATTSGYSTGSRVSGIIARKNGVGIAKDTFITGGKVKTVFVTTSMVTGSMVTGAIPTLGADLTSADAPFTTYGFVTGTFTKATRPGTYKVNGISLYNRSKEFTESEFDVNKSLSVAKISYNAVDAGEGAWYYTNEKDDTYVALKGSYTVRFAYKLNDGKDKWTTQDFTVNVKNSLYTPKVSVEKRTLDSLSDDTIIDAMKVDVDMNCNESNNKSIVGVLGVYKAGEQSSESSYKRNHKALDYSKNSVSVSYAVVQEDGFNIIVPIDNAFQVAS